MEPWLERFALANFRRSADTAHDLKTPLNVAVLNLELLRMRLRKLADGGEDEKIGTYAAALDLELRRLGRIFDTFFLLSIPPKNDEQPEPVDVAAIVREAAVAAGLEIEAGEPAMTVGHESRIRQAVKLFLEGAPRLFEAGTVTSSAARNESHFEVVIAGRLAAEEADLARIFKFYYTDPQGNPDLSLAAARLIAETYGGEVSAVGERDKVTALRLALPLGGP